MLSVLLFASNVYAGLVSHSSGYFLSVRDCPTATNESECFDESFNSGSRTFQSEVSLAENELVYNNAFSNGTLINDTENLSLPEFKFEITSTAQQRNGVNLCNYQEFVWTAEAATLQFDISFDFIMSAGLWADSDNSTYNVTVALSEIIDPGRGFFPVLSGELFDSDQFFSGEAGVVANEKHFGGLLLEHTVNTGDSLYLYTQVQSFASNGGYVDSLNTLTSNVSAFDLQGVELDRALIENALVAQNRPLAVNAPSTALFLLPLGA